MVDNTRNGDQLYGYEFLRREPEPFSFTPKVHDDGAVTVVAGGPNGTSIDFEGSIKDEAQLVTKYRELSLQPEMDRAIEEIINEAMATTPDDQTVKLNLDDTGLTDNIKSLIVVEFDRVLDLLNFNVDGYDIFRRWYIDRTPLLPCHTGSE